jgi:hypothetical protein
MERCIVSATVSGIGPQPWGGTVRAIFSLAAVLLALPASYRAQDTSPARVIIHRSVQANNADWKAQTGYSFRRSDIAGAERQTFEVTMLDGSPYERLLALNDKPIAPDRQRQEQAKLERETHVRQNQTPRQRRARIAKYEDDRADENFLMRQMVSAFTFHLAGQEEIAGVECYVLKATPNLAYHPPVEKARALTGMQGRMWIDKVHYHWVKIQAQVTRPVAFGLLLARVKPGTRFELEQTQVGDVWLPRKFIQSVNASVLGFYSIQSQDETYWSDYRQDALNASNFALPVSR